MVEPRLPVEPFLLPAEPGRRFCVLHAPPTGVAQRGGILYVHPFAEEMNKSRRMAAMQARSFASLGYAVLQMDLFGCGDSSGEMLDATVSRWRQDLSAAATWMVRRGFEPLKLWGLRFGALLAADWLRTEERTAHVDGLVLWQPIASGEIHLNQFLRIGLAAEMLQSDGASKRGGDARTRLAAGETVEVAGYDVTPTLAAEMTALRLAHAPASCPVVDWYEVTMDPDGQMSPASARVSDEWDSEGIPVRRHVVAGDAFWATVEMTDCPALLDKTTQTARTEWSDRSTSRV